LAITFAPWLVVAFVASLSAVAAFMVVMVAAVVVGISISAPATTTTAVEEELTPSLLQRDKGEDWNVLVI
jgi:hypothetical protein